MITPPKPIHGEFGPHISQAPDLWDGVAFAFPVFSRGYTGKQGLLNQYGQPLAGSSLTAGSTLQWRNTPYGLGVGISGASNLLQQDNYLPLFTSDGVGTGDFTVVCLANPPAEAVISNAVSQAVSGVQPRLDMFFNTNSAVAATSGSFAFLTRDATNIIPAVAGVIDGRYHLFGGSRDGTNVRAWIDGVLRASASGTVQNIAGTGGGFAIGNRAEHTVSRINIATTVVFVVGWNRALSDAGMRMLADDPFIMFRVPVRRKIYYIPAAGGAMTGTASIGFTTSGALTGSGAMSGSAPITFTQSGLLSGSGALSGSATMTFANAGDLTGMGALAGASAISFTPSGALTGSGALVGSATITFTPSGTLSGSGALAGVTTLTFTPSGTLTADGALAGQATITFTSSGALDQPSGSMSGTASISFSTSGTLTGSGALAGQSTITFTPSATLTGTGALSGSSAITFTLTGSMAQALEAYAMQIMIPADPREILIPDDPRNIVVH